MKLSVLLPTRNGGLYLGDSVASVLAADMDDLELVVSDNASDDNTREVLANFSTDPRLHVVRQNEPLSVTDNWSATMQASRGDHLVLIGDDDYILPGALEYLTATHAVLGAPEVLSYEAYSYAFPGAFYTDSPAHYADPLHNYDERIPNETPLPTHIRKWAVDEAFRFDPPFSLNLQTMLCSREALERLPRGAFLEPYPDFYAALALQLTARDWIHVPRKLVAVGITPKSFSKSLLGGGSTAGRAYLGIDTEFDGYLPGHDMVNGFFRTLRQLERDFPVELAGIEISRRDYVYRQIYSWYLFTRLGNIDRTELIRRIRMLSLSDWVDFSRELTSRFNLDMLRRHARVDDSSAVNSLWVGMRPTTEHTNIGEFAEWAGEREDLASGTAQRLQRKRAGNAS
jgi:glycosyltransferase involved in cell wall biosynthesis